MAWYKLYKCSKLHWIEGNPFENFALCGKLNMPTGIVYNADKRLHCKKCIGVRALGIRKYRKG